MVTHWSQRQGQLYIFCWLHDMEDTKALKCNKLKTQKFFLFLIEKSFSYAIF